MENVQPVLNACCSWNPGAAPARGSRKCAKQVQIGIGNDQVQLGDSRAITVTASPMVKPAVVDALP